jgi:hypothetical protein
METSPIVGIVDNLMFCGSPTTKSGFGDSCVYGDVDTKGVWHGTWASFWAAASRYYAPFVCGNVTVLMASYGGRDAYRRTSFFGSVELPSIDFKHVNHVHILVAPTSADAPLKASCDTPGGSIMLLQSDLVRYGLDPFKISCTNRPFVVCFVLLLLLLVLLLKSSSCPIVVKYHKFCVGSTFAVCNCCRTQKL